ncbi:hypothetical protein [Methanolobus halotolerans]|uniref:Uncharacterized protein n=1 Tax=Methanolobus halotolerans TaxID=2052935 RepID=A0A4E0PVC4_9EURY|nr:hypothetical protein [Methanolobus halotolerans]TGC07906.1 hypothetical protein CUN85_10715 [Methanolobus halotolerans]
MKKEKKETLQQRQGNLAILHRNKKLLKINVIILSIGLALSYLGQDKFGEPLLWLGIVVFTYTLVTNYIARSALKKL